MHESLDLCVSWVKVFVRLFHLNSFVQDVLFLFQDVLVCLCKHSPALIWKILVIVNKGIPTGLEDYRCLAFASLCCKAMPSCYLPELFFVTFLKQHTITHTHTHICLKHTYTRLTHLVEVRKCRHSELLIQTLRPSPYLNTDSCPKCTSGHLVAIRFGKPED